jgi:histone H3/H4
MKTPVRRKKRTSLVLKEIKYYQKITHLLIRRGPFGRLCRGILLEKHPKAHDFRWQGEALECLQEAAEAYVVHFLADANLAAHHAKRVTLMVRDLELIKALRGNM